MSKSKMAEPYSEDVFRHHKPILVDDVVPRLIKGLDGAFRERIEAENYSAAEPTVGVVVQMTMAGEVVGSRMVKCGKVMVKDMNAKDIWPKCGEAKLVISEFDLSEFGDYNGQMTTPYAELDFKVMEKQGESWKAVKKGELVSKGYSDLSFRLHCRTVEREKVKFTVVVVPCAVGRVVSTYGETVGSRGFPGIKVYGGVAKLVTKEEVEMRFGIGIEPFYHLTDGKIDEQGEIVTEGLRVPQSMVIKKVVVSILQHGLIPNFHLKRSLFEDAVKGNKWKKKEPKVVWPNPVEEDEKDTSDEETDSGGESRDLG